jgi:uncharacterized protein YjbJ (UPF0337 family)
MGSAEETKGKLKEAAGSVTGSDDLREEGQAQQHKGQQEDKAAQARATADEHERQAESFERAEQDQQATWWQAPGGPRSVAGGRSAVIRRGFAA